MRPTSIMLLADIAWPALVYGRQTIHEVAGDAVETASATLAERSSTGSAQKRTTS